MSDIPRELRYAKTHEWIRVEEDGSVTIGITDHAQAQLGDLVYVELPEEGRDVALGEELAVVESVKAASDIYAPLSGTVLEINDALADSPEMVNGDPYGDGWMIRFQPSDSTEFDDLLDADEYAEAADNDED